MHITSVKDFLDYLAYRSFNFLIIPGHMGILNQLKMTNTNTQMGDLVYYPWESLLCEDSFPEACAAFKPFCRIFDAAAYYKCRKTCGLCKKDHAKNKGL